LEANHEKPMQGEPIPETRTKPGYPENNNVSTTIQSLRCVIFYNYIKKGVFVNNKTVYLNIL